MKTLLLWTVVLFCGCVSTTETRPPLPETFIVNDGPVKRVCVRSPITDLNGRVEYFKTNCY